MTDEGGQAGVRVGSDQRLKGERRFILGEACNGQRLSVGTA